MSTVTNLTTKQLEKVQIDEGLVFIDYGLSTERKLAPTRGGGEFTVTQTMRDIEFDGRCGKTKGTQVIESEEAKLKVTTLGMSQDNLTLAVPGAVVGSNSDTSIKNPRCGVVPDTAYATNVTMFAKTLDGKYKKITIYNPMSEAGLTMKAAPKAEGELALEFDAHYPLSDLNGDLWKIEDADEVTENSAS